MNGDARLFYRCAVQRYEDAQILLDAAHTTGAVYLAGYAIECILKSLLLSTLAVGPREAMIKSFRGAKAHDFDWLRTKYLKDRHARFPPEITEAFSLVNVWSTDLRYQPRTMKTEEAESFLGSVSIIILWAKNRI